MKGLLNWWAPRVTLFLSIHISMGNTSSVANRMWEIPETEWVFAARVEDFKKTIKLVLNIKGRTIVLTKVGDDFGAVEGIWPVHGRIAYPGVIIGGQLGPLLASRIPQNVLEKSLAILFILVVVLMIANVIIK